MSSETVDLKRCCAAQITSSNYLIMEDSTCFVEEEMGNGALSRHSARCLSSFCKVSTFSSYLNNLFQIKAVGERTEFYVLCVFVCRHARFPDKERRRKREKRRVGGVVEMCRFQESVQLYSKVEWEVCGLKSWRRFVSKSQLRVTV